ncbi:Hypothetical protein SMAX5B_015074 [Scophthalmus maximus]|uniref:Uncharacterized protein n=1 Tax=Scophthalmus maximus TaxID=52904 RepID=A0A2U9CH03_SCOMX|nr:Hypothetical protein SMAX5B_015074 [Scophthalmus maximus]
MNGHSGGSNSWTRRFVMGRLRNTTTVSHICGRVPRLPGEEASVTNENFQ